MTVREAVGPDLTRGAAAGALGFGVVSLLFAGVLPALLGALFDEHRLSAAGFGECAAIEALSMGVSTALSGILLPARRLRLLGLVATLVLAALDFRGVGAGEDAVLVLRGLAGLPEGLLLWISVGMIARSETPERWAGVFFTATTAAQMLLALAFAVTVIPKFGADGGFVMLGSCTLLGAAAAIAAPDAYGALPGSEGAAGPPPLLGWVALLATIIYVAAGGAVAAYLQPLAQEAGLSANIARTTLWISLAAQIAGGAAATALAGRMRYLTAFLVSSAVFLANWAVMAIRAGEWAFIFANLAGGFFTVFVAPFLVPMTIEADPSRRAALQSGGAQLLAGALGPLVSSQVVNERDVRGVLALGAAFLIAGLAIIIGLHVTAVRRRAIPH
ncbi:MAG: MFS transporter [Alphaproteobacteria bacterium]|nr:MFS transporter [Alphaproteobacteria bacterium]